MPEKLDIVIIRGAPGSGKSQVAKSLSKFFAKGVRLEVDTIRGMVISVDWKNQQEHIAMLQASAKLVTEFLKSGYSPVMVIDTFSGDKINRFLQTLNQHEENLSIKSFALYTSDEELKRRLEQRRSGDFRDYPISKLLNDDVLRWKPEGECQFDTTGRSPDQIAEMIHAQINEEPLTKR